MVVSAAVVCSEGLTPEATTTSLAENSHAVQQSARVDVAGLLESKRDVADLQLVDVRQPGETEAGFSDVSDLVGGYDVWEIGRAHV